MHRLVSLHLRQLPGDTLVTGRRAQHDALAAIDGDGGHFARMIDPQDFRHAGGQRAATRSTRNRFGGNGPIAHACSVRGSPRRY